MEIIIVLVAIIQSMAISLGVGSSTLAIINFFVAIADGKIDPQERAMMGIVYTVLRVAMVLILLTALVLTGINYSIAGLAYFNPFVLAVWTVIGVLYLNAFLMTKHVMPSNIGPGLQAASWYTLGVLMTLIPLGLDGFDYFEFVIGYAAGIALALAIVNGIMSYQKQQRAEKAGAQ
jgi:hypothetical protein